MAGQADSTPVYLDLGRRSPAGGLVKSLFNGVKKKIAPPSSREVCFCDLVRDETDNKRLRRKAGFKADVSHHRCYDDAARSRAGWMTDRARPALSKAEGRRGA